MLGTAIGMAGEAVWRSSVDGVIAVPRPASEAGALVILEGAGDFGIGVHHEGALAGDRFPDPAALQYQQLNPNMAGG